MSGEFKLLIQKQSAEGETLAFEIKADELRDVRGLLSEAYDICDDRMRSMNVRVLEAKGLMSYLTEDERNKFYMLLDVLHGNASADVALNKLAIEREDKEAKYANENGV